MNPNKNTNGKISTWAIRSYIDVGKILGISPQAVWETEKRAFKKIKEALLKPK
jgi:DNA-directed RNA polymerase specialized sigma subunit